MLAADCLYHKADFDDVFFTARLLLEWLWAPAGPLPVFLCAYHARDVHHGLAYHTAKWGLAAEVVPAALGPLARGFPGSDSVVLYAMWLQPET